MTIIDRVAAFCHEHQLLTPNDTVVVAVSGGADSVCMLDILLRFAPALNLKLHVAHLNHQLRGDAATADAEFVRSLAQRWQLPVTIKQVDVAQLAHQQKRSVEDAARTARYQFLRQVAHKIHAEKIAVGHNADDQSETVLLHFLRGAGVDGLRGMLAAAPLPDSHAVLIRPLLDIPRAEIEAYCRAENLSFRTDATNRDENYTRNRIRHSLLPVLETFNPNIRAALRRTAALMQADFPLLERETDRAWQFVVKTALSQAIIFDREDWHSLPTGAQARILRRAVGQLRGSPTDIDFRHITGALSFLKGSDVGAMMALPHGLTLRVGYTEYTLATVDYRPPPPDMPLLAADETVSLAVPGNTSLPAGQWMVRTALLDTATVSAETLRRRPPWRAFFDADCIGTPVLRPRRPGDTFAPFGLDGQRQRLKKFMIDRKIPASLRNHIPLLVAENGEICWVCGWRTAHPCRITPATERVLSVEFMQKSVNEFTH